MTQLQPVPDTESQRAAMRKLSFLVGKWSGEARILRASATAAIESGVLNVLRRDDSATPRRGDDERGIAPEVPPPPERFVEREHHPRRQHDGARFAGEDAPLHRLRGVQDGRQHELRDRQAACKGDKAVIAQEIASTGDQSGN